MSFSLSVCVHLFMFMHVHAVMPVAHTWRAEGQLVGPWWMGTEHRLLDLRASAFLPELTCWL